MLWTFEIAKSEILDLIPKRCSKLEKYIFGQSCLIADFKILIKYKIML